MSESYISVMHGNAHKRAENVGYFIYGVILKNQQKKLNKTETRSVEEN